MAIDIDLAGRAKKTPTAVGGFGSIIDKATDLQTRVAGDTFVEGQNAPTAISGSSAAPVPPPVETQIKPQAISVPPVMPPAETQVKPTAISGPSSLTTTTPTEPVKPPAEEVKAPTVTETKVMKAPVTADVPQQEAVDLAKDGEKQSTNFEQLNQITMDFANGKINDPVFEKALNNYVSNISLYNQADMEALSQQIAQDPDLRGTGLGYALMAQAGREAGFTVSQMLGKLSSESAQRLLDMQQFGINTAIQMDTIRRSREDSDIQTMMNTGNFAGAANLMNKRFAGSGIVIDPDSLAARDQFTLDQFDTQMADIKTIAKTDPAGAAAMLQTLMDDPRYSGWFASGMTADAMVQAIVDGTFEANRAINVGTREEINTIAASPSATFDSANPHYDDLSRHGWRDTFIKIGEKMSLEEVNEIRELNGDTPLTQEEYDDFSIDPEQQEEWGQMDDFYRVRGSQESMWDATLTALKQSPILEDLLKNDPNGELLGDMKLWVSKLYEAGGSFDEATGFNIPGGMSAFVNDPANYHFIYDWPMAAFTEDGSIENPNNIYWGNRVFNTEMKDASPEKFALDQEIDKKWVDYQAAGGQLTGPEWYFASAGGKYNINDPNFSEDRIPENVRNMVGDGSTLPETDVEGFTGPEVTPTIIDTPEGTALPGGDFTTGFGDIKIVGKSTNLTRDQVYDTLRNRPDNVTLFGFTNIEDLIGELEGKVSNVLQSSEVSQQTQVDVFDKVSRFFKEQFGMDVTTGSFFAGENLLPRGRAMEIMAALTENAGLSFTDAYALTANLVGGDLVDASLKLITGKTFEELASEQGVVGRREQNLAERQDRPKVIQ